MKNLLKLSVSATALLHCVNSYIDSSVVNTKARGKFYKWRLGDISYTFIGDGDPLLLVHDLSVFSSSNDWSQIVKTLSSSHRVFTLDLLGCGRSDKPYLTYTNYLYVQLLSDFVHDVIKERTCVVASGLSASFITLADELNRNLFKKIILINPPALSTLQLTQDTKSNILRVLFTLPVLGRSCYYIVTNKSNTEYYLTESCFFNPFHVKPCHIRSVYQAAHIGNGKGRFLFASLKGNLVNADITNALKKSSDHVTILFGENQDGIRNLKLSYRNLSKDLRIREIPDTKKMPYLEKPDQVSSMILYYLKEKDASVETGKASV